MRHPVKAEPYKQNGKNAGYGVFDSHGYWCTIPGHGSDGLLLFEDSPTAVKVAEAINFAYDEGARSVRETMRDALGL